MNPQKRHAIFERLRAANPAPKSELAHTSPSFALDDVQAVLTPATPFDYDYTTRWSLSPR